MRTTVSIDDDLLVGAKRLAAETGRTLGAVIEDALRVALARGVPSEPRPPVPLPTSRMRGGPQPGLDLDDSAALLDLMESGDRPV
jgi:hypothetical protein